MLKIVIDILQDELYLKRINVSPVVFAVIVQRLQELKHYDERRNIILKFLSRANLEISFICRNLADPRFIVQNIEHYDYNEGEYYYEDDDFIY